MTLKDNERKKNCVDEKEQFFFLTSFHIPSFMLYKVLQSFCRSDNTYSGSNELNLDINNVSLLLVLREGHSKSVCGVFV